MTKNKICKIIFITLIMFSIVMNFNIRYVYGDDSDPTSNPNYYNPTTISPQEPKVAEKIGNILGVINIVGVIVSVITLMVLGIKYMFGSIEEKAEYKKTAIYYIIGAVLIFSGTTVPNILYIITTGLKTSI